MKKFLLGVIVGTVGTAIIFNKYSRNYVEKVKEATLDNYTEDIMRKLYEGKEKD